MNAALSRSEMHSWPKVMVSEPVKKKEKLMAKTIATFAADKAPTSYMLWSVFAAAASAIITAAGIAFNLFSRR